MAQRFKVREFGSCLNFSAASNKVDCGADFLGVQPLTICAWVKVRSGGFTQNGRIIDNGALVFRADPLNGRFQFSSDGPTFANTTATLFPNALNKWIFIAATRDAVGVCNMYVNGILSGTANQSSGTPASATTNVFIGANSGTSRTFDGLIDSVRVFNRILSPEEIANLYYNGQMPTVAADVNTNLIADYLFNEGGGTSATDSGPYARTGTITGAIYSSDSVCRPRIKVRDQGTCLDFSAAADKVDCGSDFIGTSDVTVLAWINPRSIGTTAGRILDNGKFLFNLTGTNRLQASSDGSTNINSQNNSIPYDNKWKFIAMTRTSAGVVNFYINGISSGTPNQSSGTPVAGNTNTVIGNNAAGSRNFDGKIDTLRIFKKILDQGEIMALYTEGRLPSVAADVNTSLAAEYLFNEGSGTTALDSGPYARNGTITGAVYSTDVAIKGRTISGDRIKVRDFGTALSFNGTSARVDGTPLKNVPSGATVAMWFKVFTPVSASAQQLLNNSSNSSDRLSMGISTDGSLRGCYFNGTTTPSSSSPAGILKPNQWYFAVLTFDGTTARLYLNSILQVGGLSPATTSGSTFNLASRGAANFFNGLIDSVRAWNRILSVDEINSLYYKGTVPLTPEIEWLFNEGSGSTALDSSGNGFNGTIQNATYTTDVSIIPRTVV